MTTGVPIAIQWIAAVGLIILTITMVCLLGALLVLANRIKLLVDKLNDIAEPLKDAAESAGNTVTTFSNSLLRPLATAAGVMAGFRKGLNSFSRKK